MSSVTRSFVLYKSLIMETVKNETHIAAHVSRATVKDGAELAFQEEAGDEGYHERKLERCLYVSLDRVKAAMIGYLNREWGSGSSIATSWDGGQECITFSLCLSSRFDGSYLTPLADLVSKYVEDDMLSEWWAPINAGMSKVYSEKCAVALSDVMRCFIKGAPCPSDKSYGDVRGL